MVDTLNKLVGKKIDEDIAQKELDNMAKEFGYTRCQLREKGGVYDCQFDVSRLQIHVDDENKIVELREG